MKYVDKIIFRGNETYQKFYQGNNFLFQVNSQTPDYSYFWIEALDNIEITVEIRYSEAYNKRTSPIQMSYTPLDKNSWWNISFSPLTTYGVVNTFNIAKGRKLYFRRGVGNMQYLLIGLSYDYEYGTKDATANVGGDTAVFLGSSKNLVSLLNGHSGGINQYYPWVKDVSNLRIPKNVDSTNILYKQTKMVGEPTYY